MAPAACGLAFGPAPVGETLTRRAASPSGVASPKVGVKARRGSSLRCQHTVRRATVPLAPTPNRVTDSGLIEN